MSQCGGEEIGEELLPARACALRAGWGSKPLNAAAGSEASPRTLVAKLVGWSEAKRRGRFLDLLKTVDLEEDVASRLPRQLSGGQQQRVGICRALMLQPAILLLDEPFSAVDPITRLGLYESFEQARQAHPSTTVLVTHDLREARRLAEFMVILDAGEVVQSGVPREVLANPATPYAERLIESQLS